MDWTRPWGMGINGMAELVAQPVLVRDYVVNGAAPVGLSYLVGGVVLAFLVPYVLPGNP